MADSIGIVVFAVIAIGYAVLYRRVRRRRMSTVSVGAVYDLLNQDRRNAVELIVEQKAEARDPESADDIPPEE